VQLTGGLFLVIPSAVFDLSKFIMIRKKILVVVYPDTSRDEEIASVCLSEFPEMTFDKPSHRDAYTYHIIFYIRDEVTRKKSGDPLCVKDVVDFESIEQAECKKLNLSSQPLNCVTKVNNEEKVAYSLVLGGFSIPVLVIIGKKAFGNRDSNNNDKNPQGGNSNPNNGNRGGEIHIGADGRICGDGVIDESPPNVPDDVHRQRSEEARIKRQKKKRKNANEKLMSGIENRKKTE